MPSAETAPAAVRHVEAGDGDAGQRLDNFLLRMLKGVPRTHVYRLLRKGEVRVNGKRARPDRRLEAGDVVRLPPVRVAPICRRVAAWDSSSARVSVFKATTTAQSRRGCTTQSAMRQPAPPTPRIAMSFSGIQTPV